jgi:NADPH2:quinone reductase
LLVRVYAASVNFPDTLTIQGLYQVKHAVPFVPGSEAAGFVEAVGSAVTGFAPGDRVAVLTRVGAFAQKVAAPAATAIRLPDGVSFDFAAAFNVTYGTAYLALCRQAKVQATETVLVLGAAGGVGLAAVEIAKARGATVIAAASSSEKLEIARESGADTCIDYSREDLKAAVRALTGGRGVDIVFDPVGDAYTEPALRSMAWEGRYLVIGFAAGQIPRIPLNLLLLKSAAAIGTFWGDWAARNPQSNAQNIADIFRMHMRGDIRARISQRFSLEKAPAALRCLMDRRATGKLLIQVQ